MRGYYDVPVLKAPNWGWEVIGYLWLGGIAGGSFVISSLTTLRDKSHADRHVARRGYAIAAVAAALCAPLLIKHLGRPERFHHMLRVWKPGSPMNAGAWTLAAFAPLAAMAAGAALFGEPRWLRRLIAAVGLPPALFFTTYTGALLGHSSVPLWAASPLLPALFACSALATGTAAIGFESRRAHHRLARAERVAAAAELLTLAAWLAQADEFAKPLFDRKLKNPFVIGAVTCGMVLPLALPAAQNKNTTWLDVLKPFLVLAGGLALRYAIVAAGKLSSQDQQAYLKFASEPVAALPVNGGQAR